MAKFVDYRGTPSDDSRRIANLAGPHFKHVADQPERPGFQPALDRCYNHSGRSRFTTQSDNREVRGISSLWRRFSEVWSSISACPPTKVPGSIVQAEGWKFGVF